MVLLPTWSAGDANSKDVATSNLNNGRLHLIQHIDEGKMEFVFSLQAGGAGDYMFNGHTFTMSDFEGSGGTYKKMRVVPADYNEPPDKLRKIERINIIFERRGSVVSAPIKIRKLGINLNEEKILPPPPEVKLINPHSFYAFKYNKQKAIDALEVRISAESMDITRELNKAEDGMALTPQWGEGQIPAGHSGDLTIAQMLGAPHDFEKGFEIEYVMNIPQAYFDENKIEIKPFIQAGEMGFYVWSGLTRDLSLYAGKGGKDIVVTLSSEDFLEQRQKRKNLIEMIGFGINRHGSTVSEAIIVKSITVKLSEN